MFENSVIVSVLKRGKASKVLHTLKNNGVSGGTIVYGEGTASNEFLKLIDYDHIHKEILFSVIKRSDEERLLSVLDKKFNFEKKNSGILFVIPLKEVITNKSRSKRVDTKESNDMDYEVIFVVVDNHRGEEVVEIANKYGSKGATIIHARGSGVHEKGSVFNITIEPEKEVVMLLVKAEMHNQIIDGLGADLKIDEPGNGIIFSAAVSEAIGLVE